MDFRHVIEMLPAKRSTDQEIISYLNELRARFGSWLHQDEFGPARREQTAALRDIVSTLKAIQRHLDGGLEHLKARFGAFLRAENDFDAPALLIMIAAASSLRRELKRSGASPQSVGWASLLECRLNTLSVQFDYMDTKTYDVLHWIAQTKNFKLCDSLKHDFGLADAQQWLTGYWHVISASLDELNEPRGAEERSSLKLLVDLLCTLWERETGEPVTAHGIVQDVYKGEAVTAAGRFVTAAVEVMLPDETWLEQHAEFATAPRAQTFLPDESTHRARQILVIMSDFVKRRNSGQSGELPAD
jgi:hypothetical protein